MFSGSIKKTEEKEGNDILNKTTIEKSSNKISGNNKVKSLEEGDKPIIKNIKSPTNNNNKIKI